MRAAFILLSLAFAAACNGLWMVMRVLGMLHVAHPFPDHHKDCAGTLSHGSFEIFCNQRTSWLPFLAIPAVAYALFIAARGKATVEHFCMFASVLALAFMILLFTVALACMVGWIPLYD
jgi:hypothetical protein